MKAAALRQAIYRGSQGKEVMLMDAHFAEYVAVVQAFSEFYGERSENHPSEFHAESEQIAPATLDHEYLGV